MKKWFCAVLLAALMLPQCGCSTLKTEYYTTKDYTEDMVASEVEVLSGSISSYNALRRAISLMVQRHEESGKLTFSNYDGTVSDDIAVACWEVKSDTALGAYAVDYMSYDINRIVSYYEAEIFINYRRTAEQVESIQTVGGVSQLQEAMHDAIRDLAPALTVRLNTAGLTQEEIQQMVSTIYRENPLMTLIEPSVAVAAYPESGLEKIFELSFDYGRDPELIRTMKEKLRESVAQLASRASGANSVETVYSIAEALFQSCRMVEQARTDSTIDSTAYGAVVNGTADSEGAAMAFMCLCIAKGIDCTVVEGRLDKETHFWNIVTIDGASRHIDVSQMTAGEPARLYRDSEILDRYWWDTDKYPMCGEEEKAPGVHNEE